MEEGRERNWSKECEEKNHGSVKGRKVNGKK